MVRGGGIMIDNLIYVVLYYTDRIYALTYRALMARFFKLFRRNSGWQIRFW